MHDNTSWGNALIYTYTAKVFANAFENEEIISFALRFDFDWDFKL